MKKYKIKRYYIKEVSEGVWVVIATVLLYRWWLLRDIVEMELNDGPLSEQLNNKPREYRTFYPSAEGAREELKFRNKRFKRL
tara:strand:+ start:24753 stop:24998 length:246 start_codon:yes stop_codon:yes gene_type:complete